jgi:hypothetical protein
MRISRTVVVVIVAGALSGTPSCLLDATAYESAGAAAASSVGGTGASTAGAGGGGGSANSGGAGGATSTGTGTMTPETCDSLDDCVDDDGCTFDVCDTGLCKHYLKTNQVFDAAPTDCVKFDCDADGKGTAIADSDDAPDDGKPCTIDKCNGMQPEFTSLTGDVDVGECGTITCSAGNQIGAIMGIRLKCWNFNSNNHDCLTPDCVGGQCTDLETTAPDGWPCIQPDQDLGACDGSGNECPD